MAARAAIPVTVLGGYLGAGKTTLVNHLLRHAEGRRILVMVNDFGELPIDQSLLRSRDGDVLTLANGCACCQVGGDLMGAIGAALRADPRPDHLLIEASGIADPARLADLARAEPELSLDAVLVMVDAANVRRQAADRWSGATVRGQLGSAGLLILNKTDLVAPAERAALADWLGAIAPDATLIATSRGEVDVALALGPAGWGGRNAILAAPDHHALFASWSAMSAEGHGPDRLRALLRELPPWVHRAKGWSTDPATGRAWAFHRVGRLVEVERMDAAPAGLAMVAIGPRALFAPALLDAAFAALRAAG